MERPLESRPDEPGKLKALLAEKDDALARSAHQIEILESKLAWFEEHRPPQALRRLQREIPRSGRTV
jgi:hypothetical protein